MDVLESKRFVENLETQVTLAVGFLRYARPPKRPTSPVRRMSDPSTYGQGPILVGAQIMEGCVILWGCIVLAVMEIIFRPDIGTQARHAVLRTTTSPRRRCEEVYASEITRPCRSRL